jgi:hypothetical protein
MSHMPSFAKVLRSTIPLLRFLGVVAKVSWGSHSTTTPLAPCEPGRVTTLISQSFEQGTLPTATLIIKKVIPYRTCGSTYCPGVSAPKTQSLAD